MRRLAALTLGTLLWLVPSPARADDGGTGFWITLWQPAQPVALFILCGAFCALWAQNTGRNAWLWFFFGLVLNVIALAVLLYQNAEDRRAALSKSSSTSQPARPA
jgi:hypothetical protein